MNDIDILHLDEAKCKAVIDFLVKRAYGKHAEIFINKDKFGYNVMLKIEDMLYYMLGYIGCDLITTEFIFEFAFENFTWRNFLNRLKNFVQKPNAYVTYLTSGPHLIDNSTSIEEIIINLDLMQVE